MTYEPIRLTIPPHSKMLVTFHCDKGVSHRALRNFTEFPQLHSISFYPDYKKYELNIKFDSGDRRKYEVQSNSSKNG